LRIANWPPLRTTVGLLVGLGWLWVATASRGAEPASSSEPYRPRAAEEIRQALGGREPTLEDDLIPIFTAGGCNAGACHGKQRGQNGFQLSLLGFDAESDYNAVVKDARGRRVFPAVAERSLLLRKPAGESPHGGGMRLPRGSLDYEIVRRWIEIGMPRRSDSAPRPVDLQLEPAERPLVAGEQLPLAVFVLYSDGSRRDVTRWTAFTSNEPAVTKVLPGGRLEAGTLPGEASIMARHLGFIRAWNTAVPTAQRADPAVYAALPRANFIDELLIARWQELGLTPSEPVGDATFLRRAHLDLIGRLPTPDEVQAFLEDSDPTKRARLIDRLLERPEYADHWANKWADLLRPNPYRVGIKATFSFDHWLRDAFRKNVPYDRFVSELLAAEGSTWRNGATVWLRDRRSPEEVTTMASQLFLGVRLECARCHQHPFEVWGQTDFYGLAACFERVDRKGTGLSPPISGGEEIVLRGGRSPVKHPLTGAEIAPRALGVDPWKEDPESDPREKLLAWLLEPGNPFFAKAGANRVWAELFGKGIVDPGDDIRATNPPANPRLLEALAEHYRAVGYDTKALLRTICTSHAYALSSMPNESNARDHRQFSRHYRQRLRAETLLDAIDDVTESRTTLEGLPPGQRATAAWTHRSDSLFLDAFGRPDANQDPPCERTGDSTMVQALALMNSRLLQEKLAGDEGRPARLVAGGTAPEVIVDEAYRAVYARPATDDERRAALVRLGTTPTRHAVEDLFWGLMNTPEFLFKD
jgi:hypothetical protein